MQEEMKTTLLPRGERGHEETPCDPLGLVPLEKGDRRTPLRPCGFRPRWNWGQEEPPCDPAGLVPPEKGDRKEKSENFVPLY